MWLEYEEDEMLAGCESNWLSYVSRKTLDYEGVQTDTSCIT